MDKILLIDGFNQMWRAVHTMNFTKKVTVDTETATVDKQPVITVEEKPDYLIIFNFFRNLRPLIELFSPDKCFFVLEGHSAFRFGLYPDYKANRMVKYAEKKAETDRFHLQKREIIRLMKHFPVTTIKADDYECDDVIATLCDDMKNDDVTVLSNDSDFIQLLQKPELPNVKVYNPIKKELMKAPDYHYVAWKSLAGDKSDNIKGLVGDKKAQTLVTNPEKFETFLKLEENRANFNINKSLIEFQSVPVDQLNITEGEADWDYVKSEFDRMEFASITNEKSWKKYVNTFNCIKF